MSVSNSGVFKKYGIGLIVFGFFVGVCMCWSYGIVYAGGMVHLMETLSECLGCLSEDSILLSVEDVVYVDAVKFEESMQNLKNAPILWEVPQIKVMLFWLSLVMMFMFFVYEIKLKLYSAAKHGVEYPILVSRRENLKKRLVVVVGMWVLGAFLAMDIMLIGCWVQRYWQVSSVLENAGNVVAINDVAYYDTTTVGEVITKVFLGVNGNSEELPIVGFLQPIPIVVVVALVHILTCVIIFKYLGLAVVSKEEFERQRTNNMSSRGSENSDSR